MVYVTTGLLKGLGVEYIERMKVFNFIFETLEVKKNEYALKEAHLLLLIALLEIFGRVLEPYIL